MYNCSEGSYMDVNEDKLSRILVLRKLEIKSWQLNHQLAGTLGHDRHSVDSKQLHLMESINSFDTILSIAHKKHLCTTFRFNKDSHLRRHLPSRDARAT